ncbi:hypothetical protein ACLKMH_12520 [Psychromonas sp. KJ10-10]|uniref:hypothetical protein n=1 Tax=Psychromonas sp. KJ10-10 TaxID=3391823 RepID=UPI0039B47C42
MPQHDQKGMPGREYEAKNNEGVVDIAKYKNTEDKTPSESSAFEQVMSQMNIADRTHLMCNTRNIGNKRATKVNYCLF